MIVGSPRADKRIADAHSHIRMVGEEAVETGLQVQSQFRRQVPKGRRCVSRAQPPRQKTVLGAKCPGMHVDSLCVRVSNECRRFAQSVLRIARNDQ